MFKHIEIKALIGFIAIAIFAISCTDDCEVSRSYLQYEPVYTTLEEIRSDLSYEEPREINTPGRIYFKKGFLYINEIGKGIHVIDNTDPSSPNKIGFVNIPGNYDLAAKGNYLYADSYIDLVVLDISDPSEINEINRVEEAFLDYQSYRGYIDPQLGLITDWEETLIEESFPGDCSGNDVFVLDDVAFAEGGGGLDASRSADTGVGGSMARFTIYSNYLYTINHTEMRLFDIADLKTPQTGNTISLGWGIETIFPYEDKLFIGAMDGMHIYDNVNPEEPTWLSTYQHVNSCDPVVVQGDFAYVTLRSGTECQGFTNQLDIVDISDLTSPTLFKSYDMQNPHGLGIDSNCLFITEGEFGLKFFDIADKSEIKLTNHVENLHAIDVIPLNNNLMVIGNDGLQQYQYDCSTNQFQALSTIVITPL